MKLSGLIASVQASPGSPLASPKILVELARASLLNGATALRAEGLDSIREMNALGAPMIGLIKTVPTDQGIYITPSVQEASQLLDLGTPWIATDATLRATALGDIVQQVHAGGKRVLADCDSLDSARYAVNCGVDAVSTTLSGYTQDSPKSEEPDLELVRAIRWAFPSLNLVAEGRYREPWQVQAAYCAGADAVVIGGALNDPVKQTQKLNVVAIREPIGCVDIGGTWMRFAVYHDGRLSSRTQIQLPEDAALRREWIQARIGEVGVSYLGVSTGGTVNPKTHSIVESKALIPGNIAQSFEFEGVQTVALNDGLASAWGHACHPSFAGKRVATLALGTGLGFGVVDRGRLLMGPQGEYPRLNDVAGIDGVTYEHFVQRGSNTDLHQRAYDRILETVRGLFIPDAVVVCGGLGLSGTLDLRDAKPSPYGEDAGLMGAAMLVCYSPPLDL